MSNKLTQWGDRSSIQDGKGCCLENHLGVESQGCGGDVSVGSAGSGIITTPGYPDHYPEDLTCVWNIQAPLNEKIELQFWDFDVTGSDDCTGDFVSVSGLQAVREETDGRRNTRQREEEESQRQGDARRKEGGSMVGREVTEEHFCGSKVPGTLVSEGESLQITFASNAQGSCRGFNATYTVKEERVTCGSTTSSQEFTFASPSYPESLPANDSLQCSITVDHGCDSPICQLRLDFDEFELQPPYWGECAYDRFYAESATPLPFLCGSNNGSHMYVNVEGRKKTDLTFMLRELEYYLYNCYDIYGQPGKAQGQEEGQGGPGHVRRRRSERREGQEVADGFGFPRQASPTTRTPTTTAAPTTTGAPTTTPTTTTSTTAPTTEGDVTVALYNYQDSPLVNFPTRRSWSIRVTQIPCDCPHTRVPKAPVGCLQYHQGLTGELKSFNFDGIGCYSEDRWCDFNAITHVSDCDIRVGYTGHYNNLDYSVCVEPESGFCGVQYQQMGGDGFSLSNVTTAFGGGSHAEPGHAQVADAGCMSDYLWVPGAENDQGAENYERFCGTKLGTARKWGTVTSFSKPFTVRVVTDADEFSLEADYMNRGFHLAYSQIPCKLSG